MVSLSVSCISRCLMDEAIIASFSAKRNYKQQWDDDGDGNRGPGLPLHWKGREGKRSTTTTSWVAGERLNPTLNEHEWTNSNGTYEKKHWKVVIIQRHRLPVIAIPTREIKKPSQKVISYMYIYKGKAYILSNEYNQALLYEKLHIPSFYMHCDQFHLTI